ncbi:hypothetical protein DPMN_083262 [Dreissena polymorpha]|uniref:Uncharacterized protein n=1 Tax=Dreissena polymorpha TaxID=45954 RepID=A0A9D3Y8F0_DREPO|nr:hypothetical protein DPMN_083262 [Dreissena polymorpha]
MSSKATWPKECHTRPSEVRKTITSSRLRTVIRGKLGQLRNVIRGKRQIQIGLRRLIKGKVEKGMSRDTNWNKECQNRQIQIGLRNVIRDTNWAKEYINWTKESHECHKRQIQKASWTKEYANWTKECHTRQRKIGLRNVIRGKLD